MAADDKNRDSGSREGVDQELERFVDRDDDSSSTLMDSDYADDFPGLAGEASENGDEPEDADPGYAAFAGEFDDPLADWPSPDAPLEELPVTPPPGSADPALEQPTSSSGSSWQDSAGQNHDHRSDRSTDAGGSFDSGQWGPGADPGQAETDELLFEPDNEPEGGADVTDSDSLPAKKTRLADYAIDELSDMGALGELEETATVRGQSVDEVPAAPGEAVASADGEFDEYEYSLSPEQEDAFEDELEDEFVDDFLNDLDMPDSAPTDAQSRQQAASRIEERSSEDAGLYSDMGSESMSAGGLAAAGGSSVERASYHHSDDQTDSHTDKPARQAPTPPGSADEGDDGRSLPVIMIVVVLLALVLLGVGGYGVVQQRGELQSEIRDLQARLATTVTPEEAEVERERQRQVQIENESLNAELEALVAENTALGEQVASLESRIAEQARLTEEAAKRAEEAAAQAAAAERQAQQVSRASTAAERTVAAGPWFVNFGSYADRAVAERWAAKLAVDDGKVLVQTATAAGKTLYRVRVVSLASQDAAERVATALEREYQLPRLWVGKN